MPTKNDELWRNSATDSSDWSDYFRGNGGAGEEILEETPPSNENIPQLKDHRQILNLLFVIDVSGSMRGQRIGMVNYALENIIKELRRRNDLNSVIKVGILEFSEEAKWITPRPVLLDDYVFTKIEAQPWLTNYGAAFTELNAKLRRNGVMDPAQGEYFAPVILFITDGEPTDVNEYPAALDQLLHNGWFKQSARYAIAVGDEARSPKVVDLLTHFTENTVNVRYADEGEALCNLIQFVAIRASQIQTSMISTGDGRKHDSVFDQADHDLFSSLLQPK